MISASQCLRGTQVTTLSNPDMLPAAVDRGLLNYRSRTIKYVVRATRIIKQHFKFKTTQMLCDFNSSVNGKRPA